MASISDINPILASALSSGFALSFAWGLAIHTRRQEIRLEAVGLGQPPVAKPGYKVIPPSTNKVVPVT